jgi:hypothetical protein
VGGGAPGVATVAGVACVRSAVRKGSLVPVVSCAAGLNFSALVGTVCAGVAATVPAAFTDCGATAGFCVGAEPPVATSAAADCGGVSSGKAASCASTSAARCSNVAMFSLVLATVRS